MINKLSHVQSSLIQGNTRKVTLSMYLSPDLSCFQGHFAENPILPGVAQLDLAILYAEKYLALDKFRIQKISQIKFMKIIKPKQNIFLMLEITDSSLLFQYFYQDIICSKGKIILKEKKL